MHAIYAAVKAIMKIIVWQVPKTRDVIKRKSTDRILEAVKDIHVAVKDMIEGDQILEPVIHRLKDNRLTGITIILDQIREEENRTDQMKEAMVTKVGQIQVIEDRDLILDIEDRTLVIEDDLLPGKMDTVTEIIQGKDIGREIVQMDEKPVIEEEIQVQEFDLMM